MQLSIEQYHAVLFKSILPFKTHCVVPLLENIDPENSKRSFLHVFIGMYLINAELNAV